MRTEDQPEDKWMARFDEIIRSAKPGKSFTNRELARTLAISERQLFRKVNQSTGLPPQQYIRHFRLTMANEYLRNGTYRTVKETAYAVGYINVSYFISQFRKMYGKRPLEILREEGWR